MKKRYAIVLAAACLLAPLPSPPSAAYNVQAPNSFDTAETGSREYKEVKRMCEEGKSPKYGADYFRNGNRLTRYELAGVMIDLMDNGRDLTNGDWTELNQMRRTYRRELEAHGWHGAAREKKKPILEIHGDLRVRHTEGQNSDSDGRARVGFTYHVDDRTAIQAGHETDMD